MRQIKPDNIPGFIMAVVLMSLTTSHTYAQGTDNLNGQSAINLSGICVDVWNNIRPCTPPDYLSFNLSDDQVMSQGLWFPDESELSRNLGGNSIFSMRGRHCKSSSSRRRDKYEIVRAIFGDRIPDMSVDFSEYLAFDVRVDADQINGLQVSRVYLGYKDCW